MAETEEMCWDKILNPWFRRDQNFGSARLRFRFICKTCYFEKCFCSMRWLGVFQGPIRNYRLVLEGFRLFLLLVLSRAF